MSGEISLKTPFAVQKFESIEDFIMMIFPDIESYLKKALSPSNIHRSDLDTLAYSELERRFKIFIQNYSDKLNEYLSNEAKHANKEVIKEVLLSTISTTLSEEM